MPHSRNRRIIQRTLWGTLLAGVVFVIIGALLFTNQQVQVAIGSWTFDTPSNYYISSSSIAISSGLASLQASGGGGATSTQQYVDNEDVAGEFSSGTHSGTQYDATSSSIQLATGSSTGQFTSRIIDSGASGTQWSLLQWEPRGPYRVGLPGGTTVESWYQQGNVDANDIQMLLRFDEASYSGGVGEAVDSGATSSYSMHPIGGASITSTALFGNAAYLDSASDQFFQVSSSDFLGDATSGTVSVWLYPTINTGANKQILAKGDSDTDAARLVLGITDTNIPLIYHTAAAAFNGSGTTDDYLYGTVGIPYDQWSHVVWLSDGTGYRTYVNGIEDTSLAVRFSIGVNSGDWFGDIVDTVDLLTVGSGVNATNPSGGTENFGGAIDDLAIFDRPLTASEIYQLYLRGAGQLRLQVRSCNDPACSGESFVGPDGTTATYYTDATSTLTLPSSTISNISTNQWFQYRAYIDSTTTAQSPELIAVSTTAQVPGSGSYPTNTPFIGNQVPFPFLTLTSFSHTLGGSNAGSVEYQIAVDSTSTWYYHNGASWSTATSGYPAHTNTPAEITTNAQTIDDEVGSGNLYWRAFLISDGSQAVELDTVSVETTSTIYFTSSTFSVLESAATTSVQVQLDEVSSSTVTVTYGISGGTALNSSTDYLLATGTVSIAAGQTSATFSVYIVDDVVAEGSETLAISLSNAQGGLLGSTSTHTMTITDNDSASVVLSSTSVNATEGSTTGTYSIQLATAPTSAVDIILTTSSADLLISTTSIRFTSSTYNSPVTVVVTAVDDTDREGTQTRTISHNASSTDANYSGISISDVTATITDNEPFVTIGSASLTITEGSSDTVSVVLGYAPTTTVTVTPSSSSQVLLSPSTFTFTSSSWNSAQTLTVTAVNDGVTEGAHAATISYSVSSTGVYEGINVSSTAVTITDITMGGTSGDSGGGAAAFALLFNTPSGIPANSSDDQPSTADDSVDIDTEESVVTEIPTKSAPAELTQTPNTTPSRFLPLIIGDIAQATYMIVSSPSSDLPLEYRPFRAQTLWNLCGSSATCPQGKYDVTVIVYDENYSQLYRTVFRTELTTASGEDRGPMLVKAIDESPVYVIENGVRRWIPSEAIFIARGYSWNYVRTLSSLDAYPLGEPLSEVSSVASAISRFTQYLSTGAQSGQVRALQTILKDRGFFPSDVDTTGYYGPITERAVTQFQQQHAITPLGVVGPLTRALLNSFLGR